MGFAEIFTLIIRNRLRLIIIMYTIFVVSEHLYYTYIIKNSMTI